MNFNCIENFKHVRGDRYFPISHYVYGNYCTLMFTKKLLCVKIYVPTYLVYIISS